MVTGGEAVPGVLFSLEIGVTEGPGIAEKVAERLGESVIFLCQRLIVHFFEEGGLFLIFGRSGNKVGVCLLIKTLMVGEHLVPDVSAATKGLLEQLLLLGGGVKAHFDGVILDYLSQSGVAVFLFLPHYTHPSPCAYP